MLVFKSKVGRVGKGRCSNYNYLTNRADEISKAMEALVKPSPEEGIHRQQKITKENKENIVIDTA